MTDKKLLTPEQLQLLKQKLQLFGIRPDDTPQQMFEKLFNVDKPLQMTVLPTKRDVTHLLCLGAIDTLTKEYFPTDEQGNSITGIESLPSYLYHDKILGMRSIKGTFPAIFKDIFIQNPPNEIVSPPQLPTAIPQEPKRSWGDRLRGRGSEE